MLTSTALEQLATSPNRRCRIPSLWYIVFLTDAGQILHGKARAEEFTEDIRADKISLVDTCWRHELLYQRSICVGD